MKPYIYIVFFFIFSLGYAQNDIESISFEIQKENQKENITFKFNTQVIDAIEGTQNIARKRSDIRTYLNQKRKISNFNLLFYKNYKNINA